MTKFEFLYDDHIGKQPNELGVPAGDAMLEFYDMHPHLYKDTEVTARVYTDENGHYSIDYPGRIAGLYADSPLAGTSGGDWYWKFSKNHIPVKITYQDENGEYYSIVHSSKVYGQTEFKVIITQGIGVTAKEMPNISADFICVKDGIMYNDPYSFQHDLKY